MHAYPGANLKFRQIDNVTFIVGGLRIMGAVTRAATVQVSWVCVRVRVCVCVCLYTYIYIWSARIMGVARRAEKRYVWSVCLFVCLPVYMSVCEYIR